MVVLLDRDGVLNLDRPASVRSIADLEVVPGAAAATARLVAAGYTLVVVTNQAWLARTDTPQAALDEIDAELDRRLGGTIAAFFVCPHGDDDDCECRKPRPGLLEQARAAYGFDPASSWFVVDDARDLEAARSFGCRAALVRTGKGAATEAAAEAAGVPAFDDLDAFAVLPRGGPLSPPARDQLSPARCSGSSPRRRPR